MKRLIGTVLALSVLLVGCATVNDADDAGLTIDLVDDANHVLEIPREFKQAEYSPADGVNFYERQAILRSELGARLYNRDRGEKAYEYFANALNYDRDNSKAHFAMGLMLYQEKQFSQALAHFQRIRREESRRFPYDIDYFTAAQMILDYFPFEAKVTSFEQTQQADDEVTRVIINKGRNQGVLEGMEFVVYRVGNAIRDVNTLDVIGQNRVAYADAEVIDLEDNNAVCTITKRDGQSGISVQIDDLLQTEYLDEIPDATGTAPVDSVARNFGTEEAEQ